MNEVNHTDVLIVGAGPTGLALALFLVKSGIRPRIIDKNAGPGTSSRALGVQGRTLEFYRQLGIADEMVRAGIEIESIYLRHRGHIQARIDIGRFGSGISPYPFILSFPQDEHEKLLISHLTASGIAVEWSTELTGLLESKNIVHVYLRRSDSDSEVCSAAYVCGCDGARSSVRQHLGLVFAGGTYEKTYFVADVAATGAATEKHTFSLCSGSQGVLLVLPIRSTGMHRLIGVVPKDLKTGAVTFEVLRPFLERQANIEIGEPNWFSTYHAHHRIAERFRVGRIFLAGDAGHIHSPVGGQGMNTGIGDAVNLSWKLAAVIRGRAAVSLLDSYEPERIAFARLLVATTDRAFRLMTGSSLGAGLFRRVLLPNVAPLVLTFARLRTAAFRTVSQTRINYRGKELSRGQVGALLGGDRLPWVGKEPSADNFVPLRSFDWQIHVYGVASLALRRVLADHNLPLHEFAWSEMMGKQQLQRDALYLVRPDGYLSLVDAHQNVVALQQFISKFTLQFGE